MKIYQRILKKYSGRLRIFHIFLLLIGLFLFSIFFYIYKQEQSSVQFYVTALLGNGQDIFVASPYWVANSVTKGTKDTALLGKVNAEILDVESYEGGSHGKYVILQLKLSAFQDRSGSLFYKNQLLEVNKWIELKFGKISEKAFLTYIGNKSPDLTKHKFRLTVEKKNEEPFIVNNLAVGDEMINNKQEVIAKVLAVRSTPAEIRSQSPSGTMIISADPVRKDIVLQVDVLANLREGIEYFEELRKLKAGEKINLFFPEATLWDGVITSVERLSG